MKPKKKYIYKSAIDGKIVSKEFASDNPSTTYRQEIKPDKTEEE